MDVESTPGEKLSIVTLRGKRNQRTTLRDRSAREGETSVIEAMVDLERNFSDREDYWFLEIF